jgi:hypothetical protein
MYKNIYLSIILFALQMNIWAYFLLRNVVFPENIIACHGRP